MGENLIDLSGIRGVHTFTQANTPTNAEIGDVWFESGTSNKYIRIKKNGSYFWQNILNYRLVGTGSSYGYSMGGFNNVSLSTIDRIIFPFDSGTATHVGNLGGSRYYNVGCDGTDFVSLFN